MEKNFTLIYNFSNPVMMRWVCYFVIWSKIVSFFGFLWVGIEVPDDEIEKFAKVVGIIVGWNTTW